MITCKVCGNQEYVGAIFCVECGSQLYTGPENDQKTMVYPRKADDPKYITIPHPEKDLPEDQLTLYLPDYEEFITIPLQAEITLGRVVEGQVITPDVDLNPYEAYENGISRLHATIRIDHQHNTYHVLDLGSANGTSLNGYDIPANSEVPLADEDILTLGKLHIKVLFPS